jgi:cytochrome c oxidase assembly protein subunit 15
MRHSFAGLAIPTFPFSTPEGGLLPATWNFRVDINFAHRVMAGVLTVALIGFAVKIYRDRASSAGLRWGAAAVVALLALQILLGAQIVWTQRSAAVTTLHVLNGALTLATTFWLTWLAHRNAIEEPSAV